MDFASINDHITTLLIASWLTESHFYMTQNCMAQNEVTNYIRPQHESMMKETTDRTSLEYGGLQT
jgi:hypothetical protein